jgi:hypothetical protein
MGEDSSTSLVIAAAVALLLGAVGGYFLARPGGPGTGDPGETGPCPDGPGKTFTVTISANGESDPPFTVEPDPVGPVEQCDIIVFINDTGEEVSLDFNPEGGEGSPFFGESKITMAAGESSAVAVQVDVDPEQETDYEYTVSVGGLDRSPIIRVGPRKTSPRN